jgi:Ca-activated chloride channel family protein
VARLPEQESLDAIRSTRTPADKRSANAPTPAPLADTADRKLPTLAKSVPVNKPREDLERHESESRLGRTQSSTKKPVQPSAGLAASAPQPYALDPVLAGRYGLAPKPAALPPAAINTETTLAESIAEPGEKDVALTFRYVERDQFGEVELGQRGAAAPGTESYAGVTDNPFKDPFQQPLSTFGLDVDTASYSNVRRFLRDGSLPPADAVRIEELVNYFRYEYPQPSRDQPFGVAVEIAESPWSEGNKLVRIGLQAKSVDRRERPPANLILLLDVSGSMEPENKLPLVRRALRLLVDRLAEKDSVGIVTYAGQSGVALEPTLVTSDGRARILQVIEGLRAGGSTAGGAGIVDAYRLASRRFHRDWVNRVLLCTDGDFNVGITDRTQLQRLIEEQAKSGVFLSVLGFGLGNLKDATMELLADKGNGNYAYIDSFTEARKVLAEQIEGTLVTVAKDTKVQVEFNPSRVRAYRLIGYENRALRDRDFNDDTKDAGDVGAGHQVTVLYEIEPSTPNLAGVDPLRYQSKTEPTSTAPRLKQAHSDELLNLRLRYKEPNASTSQLMELPVLDAQRELRQTTADFRFATAVAGYGMLLRQSPHRGALTWELVLRLAEDGLGPDRDGYRAEFIDLVRKAQTLAGPSIPVRTQRTRP